MEMEMKAQLVERHFARSLSVSVLSLVSLSNTKNGGDEELDKHKPFLQVNRFRHLFIFQLRFYQLAVPASVNLNFI